VRAGGKKESDHHEELEKPKKSKGGKTLPYTEGGLAALVARKTTVDTSKGREGGTAAPSAARK